MDDYVRDIDIVESSEEEKRLQLINSIIKTRRDLNRAHINFEYAESGLIDYYTYEIKANQSKLDYLTKLAKIKKIAL